MNIKIQNVHNFCFHGNETYHTLHHTFDKNYANSKHVILLLQTDILIMYAHSHKSTDVQQIPRNEINSTN